MNPDGTNLALALEQSNVIEVFDFDNETGKVSKPISMTLPDKSYVYGIEFSPDGSLLYVSAAGTGEIYQYNLQGTAMVPRPRRPVPAAEVCAIICCFLLCCIALAPGLAWCRARRG